MHTRSAVNGKMSTEERFQSFSWLRTVLLVVSCIISEASFADAVIIDQQTGGCGGSFTGTVGNFTSPGYPNNYAENLQCQYNITVDVNSRIHIDFIYIEIEAGDGCLYDSLLFRDGLDASSPVLAKICHPHPVTIKSSGSSVSVLFSSDSTIGFRGFHLTWRAVPKVPLLKPDGMSITSPWIGIATPQDLVQIDSGISEYLWAVDKGANVYVYGNGHWDLVSGRMSSVTSGESVLATSKDGAVWYRQGVSMGSPKGLSWQRASITTPMRKVESGRVGVVIAIDSKGTVYQLQLSSNGPTGVLHKLYDANPNDPFVDVSCGSYACWFVSKNGALFMAESIQSYFVEDVILERVAFRQVSTPAKIKQVAAGFDGSVWAITVAGNVYKRKGVSMLLPDGVSWAKTANVNFKMITSGFLGVYGVTKSNIIITMEDMKCGGIITAKKGMFTSPNYPRIYPADLKCLWILRIPGATSISVRFIKPTGLGKSSVCDKDFLVTYQDGKYPSSTEPVIECGTKIADKMFLGNEAWFEFNSGDDTVRNLGFRAVFDASFVVKTTSKPTTDTGNDKSTKSDLLPPPIIITELNTAAPLSRSTLPNTEVIMPPKPAFTERTTPKQQGPTTDSGMPPLPTNVARTDRSTADPRRPPLPSSPSTDAVRPPIPTTTDTSPRPDLKTPSVGGAKIPAGWERIASNVPLSQIVTGFSNRAWGLDSNGRPFVNVGGAWRQVGDNKYRSLAVSEDSVWAAVTADGDVYYRQGITKGLPSGSSWVKIPSLGMKKVILGPRNKVFAVSRDGILYRRSGVTYKSPYGTNWVDTGKRVLDATVGSFGIHMIDLTGRLQFAEIKMDENMKFSESDWRTADGPQLREINSGHGSSLWGIQANDGVVVERQGVEALYPLGKSWKTHEGKTSTVNPGMFDVYRTLSDGTILKRKGNKCGGIISSMQGNIKSPDYPSNYPANAYCLWLVKVPEAKKIEVRVEDFELEEDRYCRSDRMIIFDKMSKEPIYGCGKMAPNKNFTGDNFMVEFQSDGSTEKRGFNLRYNSYFKKDLISASTQKPTTTMKKEDCNMVCSADYNPICASDGKTYANECIMKFESCATNKNISMKSKGECQDCPKACTTDYKPICGSDDKTYANECVMKAESCLMKKNITLKSRGECEDCAMNCKPEYDPVCGSDDQTYDNECIMKSLSCKMKKDIFVKSRGSCQVSVCSIKCPTDFSPVCGTNNRTYANECILKAESCLQRKVISVKSKGVCPESIPNDWKLVKSPQKMSMVASGINDNLWALDTYGKPYLMLNNTWELMDLDSYKSLEVDDFGVWGVRKDGTILYRKGVTEKNPQGESWVNVDGTNIMKVSADSMNNVLAVRNDGRLLARAGVSDKMPTGTSWVDLGERLIDASISDYGVWVIDQTGTLKFAKKNANDDLSSTRLNFKPFEWTAKMKSIAAGHGGSLWGITQSGLTIWRTGISFQQPAGANWRMVDGGTSSVSPGLYMVYRSLLDGRIVQKQDNICGGVLSSAGGTIKTPNYPSPYPNNMNCLWKIKVPAAKTIDLMYKDFELESGCFNDRMTTVHQSFEKDIIECGTKVRNKKILGDMVMIEFISNGNVQKRGFHAVYKAVVMDAMKTTPKPEIKAPSGWEFVKPIMKMSMVASGVNDDIWALDSSGRPHAYVNMQWKQVQPGTYKSLAVDDRGVWGIRNDGMVTYRKGITGKNPMGESWMAVDGRNIRKIIVGSMNEVLAVRDDGALLTRLGVSAGSPTGASWVSLGKAVKDASIGSYGIWVIDNSGILQFARTLPDADLSRSFLRWRDVDGDLKAISAGFGGSLWGILKNGTVVKRENVNSGRPTGTRWMTHDGMTTSVSPGVYEVYRTLSDGTVVKRTDNTCGGLVTSLSGTLQTPNFPSNYPRNSNCLWLIKVPKVDQIEVKYGNFELEEDRYCRTDRMVTMAPRIYRPPRECGTRVQNKRIASNIMMIEFISNDSVGKRGFKASYMASVIQETTTRATTTTTTTMKPTTTTMPNLAQVPAE